MIRYAVGVCKSCGERRPIVNKHFGLCSSCNIKRLGRQRINLDAIEADEIIYQYVWDTKEHICEECGVALGDRFRDDDGKVIDRFRYSHILPKSTYPEYRRNAENFNLLCLKCHMKWENGDKQSMKIWKRNQKVIKRLRGVIS